MAHYIAFVDGASRGNPGEAAIGVSVQLPDGSETETISETIGITTNNEAEYHALIEALRLAHRLEPDQFEVRADSELIVRQMNGEYKVKHPKLKLLWREARALADSLKSFRIQHVPREQNARADELANEALDLA